MRNLFYTIFICITFTLIYSCTENVRSNKFEMKISCAVIDTLDGLEFAYRVNIDNNTNKEIDFFAGLEESDSTSSDGFI